MISEIAQLVLFTAWFVVLWRYRPLRDLVISAPRSLTIPVAALLAAWTVVHLADARTRYFPLISVYMYGERTPATSLTGIAVRGTPCQGTEQPGRISLEFMGRVKPRHRLQSEYLILQGVTTATDSAASLALINSTLGTIGRIHNEVNPDRPLCAIGLDEVTLRSDQYGSGTPPAPSVVHEITLR